MFSFETFTNMQITPYEKLFPGVCFDENAGFV